MTDTMPKKGDDAANKADGTATAPADLTATPAGVAPQNDNAAPKPFQQRWGDEAHTALLCIFVDIMTDGGAVSIKAHQERIVAGMAARGFAFSWEATRQHLQKLRRKEEKSGDAPAAAAATPKTPRKRAAAVKKEPGSSVKRKSAATVTLSDDEEDEYNTPSKKMKMETGVKEENEEDGNGYV